MDKGPDVKYGISEDYVKSYEMIKFSYFLWISLE